MLEESDQLILERQERVEEARRKFDAVSEEFSALIAAKLETDGAGAAWALIQSFLHAPKDFDDKAKVLAAAGWYANVLGALAVNSSDTKDFVPLLTHLITQFQAFASDQSIPKDVRAYFIAKTGGLPVRISIEDNPERFVDEVWTYDFEPPIPAIALADLRALNGENQTRMLGELTEVLVSVVKDPSVDHNVKKAALAALGAAASSKVNLTGLAIQDGELCPLVVETLASSQASVNPDDVFAIYRAHDNLGTKAAVLRNLGMFIYDHSQTVPTINEILSSQSVNSVKDLQLHEAAIDVAIGAYVKNGDQALLSILTGRMTEWANQRWVDVSPIVRVAEKAASCGLKDMVPFLESVLSSIANEGDRARVSKAISEIKSKSGNR